LTINTRVLQKSTGLTGVIIKVSEKEGIVRFIVEWDDESLGRYTFDELEVIPKNRMRRRNPWTSQQKELLRKLYTSVSQEDIQKAFPDKRWDTIQQYASRVLKLKRYKKGPGDVVRDLSTEQAAWLVGMASNTFERHYAREIPHDVTHTGAYRFNKDEVLNWHKAAIGAGRVRDISRAMVSPTEAATRLRAILNQLPIDIPEFAKYLKVSLGTMSRYLTGRAKGVPQEIITEAETFLFNYLHGSKLITSRIPVEQGSMELRIIQGQLAMKRKEFAEALRIKPATLGLYLDAKARDINTIPTAIIKKARALVKEHRASPPPSKRQVLNALRSTNGIRKLAAQKLNISETFCNTLIEFYDLEDHAKPKRAADWITKKELMALMKRFQGNKRAAARKIGVDPVTFYRLLKMAGLEE